MTDDTLRCDTKADGNRIDLFFNGYPNGGTKKQYDVELYKKGDLPLSLEPVTRRGARNIASFGANTTSK
jgi:hypothetical protein